MKRKMNQFRMNVSFSKQHDLNVLNGKEMKYNTREAG